jgi:hypothetical protein
MNDFFNFFSEPLFSKRTWWLDLILALLMLAMLVDVCLRQGG